MSVPNEVDSLFELCTQIIAGEVTSEQGIERVKQMKESNEEISSQLLDSMVISEATAVSSEEEKARFLEFATEVTKNFIPRDVLAIELACMEANLDANKKHLVRLKTRLYFKQSKFNLLREESEGYSKLITELLEGTTNSAKVMMTRVLCLIGQFNLDPNRVIDVVLQCFECCPERKAFFISLLKEIKANRDYLCTILGFEYSFYQGDSKNTSTPFSLYEITAALIEADLVDLMKILTFMQPKSEGIKESHRARAANANVRAKKLIQTKTRVSNSILDSVMIDSSYVIITLIAQAETIITTDVYAAADTRLNMNADSNQPTVGVPFATVTAVQEAEDLKLLGDLCEETVLAQNQKLGLLCALVELGDWTLSQIVIERLPEFYAVQASSRISRGIANMVEYAINDFYLEMCPPKVVISKSGGKLEKSVKGIEKVSNWSELAALSSVLWYLGPRIGYSPKATTKLIRLIAKFIADRQADPENLAATESLFCTFMEVVDEVLLPSLSLQPSIPNAAISEELWNLLQLVPYHQRYRLYGRWKTTHSTRHPEISVSKSKILGRTKYVLKRLSKETVKVMGRQLGKLCHIHPIFVFDYLLGMVQTFDNFIGPVVESFKFLTNLEFDILSFCIIEQLASPDRQQLKASDGNLSLWLQALGTLVGSIYKKYNIELTGILTYVAKQLQLEKSLDLIILREIIQNMASVESCVDLTLEQLEALQGGECLRTEAGGYSNVRNKRATTRLKEAVVADGLYVLLSILMGQQRECVIHRDSQKEGFPLKLTCEIVDQCRDTLMQFVNFLLLNLKVEEYAKRVPMAPELIRDYHLPLDTAMMLTRPIYMMKVFAAYDATKKKRKALETDAKDGKLAKMASDMKFTFFKEAFEGVVNELIAELKPCLPKTMALDLPDKQLVIFWLLSGYDIETPTEAYERALDSIKKQLRELFENHELSKARRVKEEERLKALEARLRDEQRRQDNHVERVRMWMSLEKETLFEPSRHMQMFSFLQSCVIPRAIFSELDAIFCAKMILQMHLQKTHYFQTIVFLDKLFCNLLPIICGLTELEAASLGRFLEIIMGKVIRWHHDKAAFEKDCAGYPGLLSKVTTGEMQAAYVNFESFKRLAHKWQKCIQKFLTSVFSDEKFEYIVVRNCLVVASKMTPYFPVVRTIYDTLEDSVLKLRDREKGHRDDLALKASSYAARLKQMSDEVWANEDFSLVPERKSNGAAPERKRPANTATQDNADKKKRAKVVKTEKSELKSEPEEENGTKPDADNEQNKEGVKKEKEDEADEKEVDDGPPRPKLRIPTIEKENVKKPADKENAIANGKPKERERDRKERKTADEKTEKDKDRERPRSAKKENTQERSREVSVEKHRQSKEPKEPKEEEPERRRSDRPEKREKREKIRISLDEEVAGPLPPPTSSEKLERAKEEPRKTERRDRERHDERSERKEERRENERKLEKREERIEERKEEKKDDRRESGRTVKRAARSEATEAGEIKVSRKDRDIESRVTRRPISPPREKERERVKERRPSRDSRSRRL